MTQYVHFIPVGLGQTHYTRPLVGGNFSMSKIVLLAPADVESQGMSVEATKEFLIDIVDIDPEVRHVPTDGFDRIVAAAYHDIYEEIDAGNEVFINGASSPWGLGTGYVRAAEYVLGDAQYISEDTDASTVRDQITLYYTEPDGYYIDELTAVATQASNLQERVQQAKAVAGDLREDVDTDVRTIKSLLWILKQEDKFPVKIEGILGDTAANFPNNQVQEISDGLRDIVNGIELITQGINVLSKEENLAVFEKLPSLLDQRIRNLAEGIQQVADRADEYNDDDPHRGEYSSIDLFRYFVSRLEQVHDVLKSVEQIESDQFGNKFEHSADDIDNLLSTIKSSGVTRGARKFEDSNYSELPKPLDLELSEFQRAIVYVLAVDGKVDSLQKLTIRVAHHALVHADERGGEIPSHPQIEAIHQCDENPQNEFFKETLVSHIQAKIQYNVNSLVDAGFVRKDKFGRGKSVSLSHSGEVYAAARGLIDKERDPTDWRETAFEELSADVVRYANDYVQSFDSTREGGSE